jgi:hypothetical protein
VLSAERSPLILTLRMFNALSLGIIPLQSATVRLAAKSGVAPRGGSAHMCRYFDKCLRGRFPGKAAGLFVGPATTISVVLEPIFLTSVRNSQHPVDANYSVARVANLSSRDPD